ncbi:hypothetical protein EDF56_105504 [Novosphingobium sp. PhB165]|uniref:hypothetical protein n=1 Tax=Novosphingobium sp. PhB165 TaxID=2485105 RepID=UPI0010F377D0|nr:hypothetical protein [Novosphingobium sp. PhB165]TCM18154.1 hypothetical protein EDF56_105504 [Novosphingobium sp. PhB165]
MVRLIPQAILCLLDRHDPERENVTWDGAGFSGNCRHCGLDVRREKHKVWRRD